MVKLLFPSVRSVLIVAFLSIASPALAQEESFQLDNELAELLGERKTPAPKPDTNAVQQGEDVGAADDATDDPIKAIGLRMREAQELLARRDTSGAASAAQREVMQQLDQLIAQQRRSRTRNPTPPQTRQQAIRTQTPQPNRPDQRPPTKNSPRAAQDAGQSRPNGEDHAASTKEEILDVLEQLWGQLPQRTREQMQQLQPDAFLPEFELDIERYFRRLAEDPDFRMRSPRRPHRGESP